MYLCIVFLYRFVVGPYEEHEYLQKRSEQMSHYTKQQQHQASTSEQGPSRTDSAPHSSYPRQRYKPSNRVFHLINQALRVYRILIHKIKCCGRHLVCPHPFSCLYYTLQVHNQNTMLYMPNCDIYYFFLFWPMS